MHVISILYIHIICCLKCLDEQALNWSVIVELRPNKISKVCNRYVNQCA